MKKLLLLIVMTFPVGEKFNVQGFLEACQAQGILLYAPTPSDSPHGHILLENETLTVTLYEKAKAPATFKRGRSTIIIPGNSVLPGKLASRKPTIQAAVKTNNP